MHSSAKAAETAAFAAHEEAAAFIAGAAGSAAPDHFDYAEKEGSRVTVTFDYPHAPPRNVMTPVCNVALGDNPGDRVHFETSDLDHYWDCAGKRHELDY